MKHLVRSIRSIEYNRLSRQGLYLLEMLAIPTHLVCSRLLIQGIYALRPYGATKSIHNTAVCFWATGNLQKQLI